MKKEELRAVADVLKERLSQLSTNGQQLTVPAPTITIPAPHVHNEVAVPSVEVHNEVAVPSVQVVVDTAPIAAAMAKFTEAVEGFADMLSQLLQVLSEQKPPTVTVGQPEVHVEAPQMHLPPREKRKFTIKHDDNTTSIVTEA